MPELSGENTDPTPVATGDIVIDAALGEANKSKSQDFSKIQGRFHTRLSLASSNTDEVIGERLLAKTEDAHQALRGAFEKSGDIINNQLAFVGNSVNLRGYKDGTVYLVMKGSCSGCPSSTATLKHGIQNLLRHFLPQVREVEAV